jgi:hypothetical protein
MYSRRPEQLRLSHQDSVGDELRDGSGAGSVRMRCDGASKGILRLDKRHFEALTSAGKSSRHHLEAHHERVGLGFCRPQHRCLCRVSLEHEVES